MITLPLVIKPVNRDSNSNVDDKNSGPQAKTSIVDIDADIGILRRVSTRTNAKIEKLQALRDSLA